MGDLGRCEYSTKRGARLLRCTNTAKQTVYLEGQTFNFCPGHAAQVTHLLAHGEKLQKNYEKLMQEIQAEKDKIIQAIQEVRNTSG